METMTNELTVIPGTIGMMGGMGMLKRKRLSKYIFYSSFSLLTFATKK